MASQHITSYFSAAKRTTFSLAAGGTGKDATTPSKKAAARQKPTAEKQRRKSHLGSSGKSNIPKRHVSLSPLGPSPTDGVLQAPSSPTFQPPSFKLAAHKSLDENQENDGSGIEAAFLCPSRQPIPLQDLEGMITPKNKKKRKTGNLDNAESQSLEYGTQEKKIRRLVDPPCALDGHATERTFASAVFEKQLNLVSSTFAPVWPAAILELEQMFHALESTLTFLSGRDNRAIFHKIKKAVENICHRSFQLRHLAQMMSVIPGLYELEPVEIVYQGERTNSLVLRLPRSRPSTPATMENEDHTLSLSVQFRGVVCGKAVPVCDDKSVFSRAAKSNQIIFDRKRIFKDALNAHVSAAVEKNMVVPEIEEAILPIRAHVPTTKVSHVLLEPLGPSNVLESQFDTDFKEEPIDKPKSRAASLLDRIRDKERKLKASAPAVPDASKMKQRAMMRRLPEMVQCIKMHFSKEKKTVMSLYKVAKLVSAGLQKNPMSDGEAFEHIRFLTEVAPAFISIVKTDSGSLARVQMGVKGEEIEGAIREKLENLAL